MAAAVKELREGRPSIELAPGVYVLEATAGSAGHNGFPAAYGFTGISIQRLEESETEGGRGHDVHTVS